MKLRDPLPPGPKQTLLAGQELLLPEPNNTRGWPKNPRQQEVAIKIVRDGLSPFAAVKEVYGARYANSHGYKLAHKLRPFIAFLQERKNALAEREFEASTERVLREISAIALSKLDTYKHKVFINGKARWIGKPPDELTDVQRIAVKGWTEVEVKTDGGVEIDYRYELYDKDKALPVLMKHLGMLSETLLVDMMSRRQQSERVDYSNVPTEVLEESLVALNATLERLKDARAIESVAVDDEEAVDAD